MALLPPILERIVSDKRREVEALEPKISELLEGALRQPPARGFVDALAPRGGEGGGAGPPVRLIAEMKRRSPSKGILRHDYDPCRHARDYEKAGAAALSVLTDTRHFGGSLPDLVNARGSCRLPVLRKDFVIDPVQVWEARASGADAVLLIVRLLTVSDLGDLLRICTECGIDALVEVHGEAEVESAVEAGARCIGVNARDLGTFEVDLGITERILPRIPDGIRRVAESGIRSADDVRRVANAGADAVLVGEALMTRAELGPAVKELLADGGATGR